MIGNGAFALLLKSTFLDGHAVLSYRGEEQLGGRRTARYDFRLSQWLSGYHIDVVGGSGVAGLKGSAWVDPESLDVLRLETRADEIPPALPVKELTTIVNYARTRVGDEEEMLPQNGELHMVAASGEENRNLFEFTHCRQFQAESSVSFELPASEPAAAPRKTARAPVALPAGLEITVALTEPIDDKAAVGGLIEGRVIGGVTYNRATLIPAGAAVRGRIRRLERHADSGGYFAVGLEFTEIESGGASWLFYADLIKADPLPGFEWTMTGAPSVKRIETANQTTTIVTMDRVSVPDLPGVGSFFVRGADFSLPKSFRTVWRTRSPAK